MADTATSPDATPAVRAIDVSKRFGGTQALDQVSVDLAVGEVHAFVGENGAGKSTLGKVVAGIYTPDKGRLQVRGEDVERWDTVRAQRSGVVMVAQELALVPELTVEQNVFLGIEHNLVGVMRRDLRRRYEELEDLAELGLDPRAVVGELRIADQQKVEILRGLAREAQVIVLDEPTSSLTAHETQLLHVLIDSLRQQGRTIVYVSHFLDAVLEISDTVSVLRDGRMVRTFPAADATKSAVVEAMLGRKLDSSFPDRPSGVDAEVEPVLSVRDLRSDHGVESATLDVRPGEIVGLLGLVGSGRTEIAKAIFGEHRMTGGAIRHAGKERSGRTPPARTVRAGIAMVPEDRHREGLVLGRSVKENVSLASLGQFAKAGVTQPRAERRAVRQVVDDLGMRPPAIDLPVSGFSGGNQQKALLAKWLIGNPDLIILDEPTRGVDVGAKRAIYDAIVEMAEAGMAVLLISSEHEEVLNLAHRAYLVERGRTTAEVDPAGMTTDELLIRLFADPEEAAS